MHIAQTDECFEVWDTLRRISELKLFMYEDGYSIGKAVKQLIGLCGSIPPVGYMNGFIKK